MQIRELERRSASTLVERRPGEMALTDAGLEVAQRAEQMLAATRDLADFARHRGRLLTGRMQLGVIPSIAPYVLPQILPALQRRYPDLRIELRETQTHSAGGGAARAARSTYHAGAAGRRRRDRDAARCSTTRSCSRCPPPTTDRQARASARRHRHAAADPAGGRPLPARSGAGVLLHERRGATSGLGATSLATVMQMVANGYGVTLLPRVAVDVELRDERVKLLRFAEPAPGAPWPRLAAHLAAQGRFRGARPAHHRDVGGDTVGQRGSLRPAKANPESTA